MLNLMFVFLLGASFGHANDFSDAQLAQILKSTKAKQSRAVVYTWSPNMVLSQVGLREILSMQWPLETRLIVVLDPTSDPKLADTLVRRNAWPKNVLTRMNSKKMLRKGIRVHYPSYVFFKNGKMSPVVPGYKNPLELKRLRQKYL